MTGFSKTTEMKKPIFILFLPLFFSCTDNSVPVEKENGEIVFIKMPPIKYEIGDTIILSTRRGSYINTTSYEFGGRYKGQIPDNIFDSFGMNGKKQYFTVTYQKALITKKSLP